jgi:phosphoribosylformimino-5-aminoimidazole carboxamide ribotide isomerase
VIPAVDILDHRVVQLVGGVPGTEQVVLPDPVEVAKDWEAKGARSLHVVDLDGAFGKEDNLETIKDIVHAVNVPVQVGGGVKDEEKVGSLISAGAAKVIIGTRGVKEPEWLRSMAERFPGRIVLALDVKGGRITLKGWQESAGITLEDMFSLIRDMPLAGVLNTNVDVEGQAKGIDLESARRFVQACPHPVIASGGVTSMDDVVALHELGVEAAVVGVAIYTGRMRPWEWPTPFVVP